MVGSTEQEQKKMTIPKDDAVPLTAADLIQLLIHLPPDQVVCLPRDEGGFSPITAHRQITLLANVNQAYWYGSHDYVDAVPESEQINYDKQVYIVLLR
jgi:hypothetical protein